MIDDNMNQSSIDDDQNTLTVNSKSSISSGIYSYNMNLNYPNVTYTGGPSYTISSSGTAPLSQCSFYSSNITAGQPKSTLSITGEDADVLINGKSLKNFMEKMEERLAILQPDPKKLEKFEALKNAYEQYKMLEKLVGDD